MLDIKRNGGMRNTANSRLGFIRISDEVILSEGNVRNKIRDNESRTIGERPETMGRSMIKIILSYAQA